MFSKSITLINVILLENDLNFFLSKCGLIFSKSITLINVILLANILHCSMLYFWRNITISHTSFLHLFVHITGMPIPSPLPFYIGKSIPSSLELKQSKTRPSASVWIVLTLGKKVWIFQCKMARVTGLLQSIRKLLREIGF